MASTSINTVTRLNQGTDEQTWEFTMEQLIFKNIHAHFDKNWVMWSGHLTASGTNAPQLIRAPAI